MKIPRMLYVAGIKYIAPAFMAVLLLNCDDTDEVITDQARVSVEFTTGEKVIKEDSGTQSITIRFDQPASADGNLIVSVKNLENAATTHPAALNGLITLTIKKNDEQAVISITPVNNATADGNRAGSITLESLTANFISGQQKTITLTIQDDESTVVNFVNTTATLAETNTEGFEFSIQLSENAVAEGAIDITLYSEKGIYNTHFLTVPAPEQEKIRVKVLKGDRIATFRIIPINNTVIGGDLQVMFSIAQTYGSLKKGSDLVQQVRITDDELASKPKGYEVSGGGWGLNKTIEYDPLGRVSKIHWNSYTPYHRSGIDTYYYNNEGLLIKINKYEGSDVHYRWENGRITKSEQIRNGILTQYADYDYDQAGNVSGFADYHLQQDGTFKMGLVIAYLYFNDGNVYRQLVYTRDETTEELILISTKTYDHYIDVENHYPMVEILPGVKSQAKLPTFYMVEENGTTLQYNLSYEYRQDGLPAKRIASGPSGIETAVYHYY